MESITTKQQQEKTPTYTFSVTGMNCGSCVAHLESKLGQIPDVESVSVSLMLNKAVIKGGNKDNLFQAIKDAGYVPVFLSSKNEPVKEKNPSSDHLLSHSTTSKTSLQRDVSDLTSPLLQGNGDIPSSDPYSGDNSTAPSTLNETGIAQTPTEKLQKESQSWRLRLIIALIFEIPILIIAMVLPFHHTTKEWLMKPIFPHTNVSFMGFSLFVLATPIQFGVGLVFLKNAFVALKNGHSNMSVLIAIGSLSAYFYSLVGLGFNFFTDPSSGHHHGHDMTMNEHFFETSSSLITIVIFGQYLENVAKGHTSSALSKLMTLQPSTATVVDITNDGLDKTRGIVSLPPRTNQVDDDFFHSLELLIPSFSYHYSSSATSVVSSPHSNKNNYGVDDIKNRSPSNDDDKTIVIGQTKTTLTPVQQYQLNNLLGSVGMNNNLELLDNTHDINQYIISGSDRVVNIGPQSVNANPPSTSSTVDSSSIHGSNGELKRGDFVKIVRGSKIPADCIIILGTCYIDDSAITGESIQRTKIPGSTLITGTVVMEGTCIAKVLNVGEDTALAQIVNLVEQAQTSKAPISTFADQISLYFVPTIIILSILTFVTWFMLGWQLGITYKYSKNDDGEVESLSYLTHAIIRAVAVVVIACPCALGLATPTAVMVATGVGANNGVLIKGGAALEAAANIDTVVFDKTGTITKGKPEVVCSMIFAPGMVNDINNNANQHELLSLMNELLPNHLLMIQDAVQVEHYSNVISKPLRSSTSFGQINIHLFQSTQSTTHLFPDNVVNPYPNQLSDPKISMSVQLKQLLRVIYTMIAQTESNSEHFIGRCLSKYMNSYVSSYGADLLNQSLESNVDGNNVTPEQWQLWLKLNTANEFVMSHVVNQTGRGVKCDISIPYSVLSTLFVGLNSNKGTSTLNSEQITSTIVIGNANWLTENNVKINPIVTAMGISLESQGLTAIYSSIQGQIVGFFAIGDEIKPEAYEVMDYLQNKMKNQIYVLTGDNIRNARFLAQRLNIPPQHVYAHLSPANKLNIIKQLQVYGHVKSGHDIIEISEEEQEEKELYLKRQQKFRFYHVIQYIPIIGHLIRFFIYLCRRNVDDSLDDDYQEENEAKSQCEDDINYDDHNLCLNQPTSRDHIITPIISSSSSITNLPHPRHVLFVGDGINDSPALTQAQVGIAIGAGTDIAIESADMVLISNDLRDLVTAISLSQATLHRIKSNFGWSLLYNTLAVPLAAGALFPLTKMILPPEVAAFAMGGSSVSVILSSLWLKFFKSPLGEKKDKVPK